MSRNSSTRFALLGLLTLKPMTGYEMRKFIDSSISFFWRESYGNIYPILKQLSRDGMVEVREKRQSGRPDRKIYRLTRRGRDEFRNWQRQSTEEEHFKSELLLKLFFGCQLSPQERQVMLGNFAEQQSRLLDTYDRTRREIKADAGDDPSHVFWLMTLRRGEMVARARLAWAKECLKKLKRSGAGDYPKRPAAKGRGSK